MFSSMDGFMSESVIPKKLNLDLSMLPESVQMFHLNTARNNGISLEEQLLNYIKVHTEQEQEEIGEMVVAESKNTRNLWKALGVNADGLIDYFDAENEEEVSEK
jgi:hypothetical protein